MTSKIRRITCDQRMIGEEEKRWKVNTENIVYQGYYKTGGHARHI